MTLYMRLTALICIAGLTACAQPQTAEQRSDADKVKQTNDSVNVIDAVTLNELMLTVSDPEDAVVYFRDSLQRNPARVDLKRGYALSLARSRRHADAIGVFQELVDAGQATDEIRLEYTHSLARLQRWEDAETQLALVSPALETPPRYMMVAMLADQSSDWPKADKAYERARRLTSDPANILNNWGVSRMSRKEYDAASRLFVEALAYNPRLFNARNNLAVSRTLEGEHRLPLVTLSEEERATLLHNVGVIALRRGHITDQGPVHHGA